MYGSEDLFTALNVSAVTTGLDNYVVGEDTYKALFGSNVLPSDFSGDKSINFYMSLPYNASTMVPEYGYTINCRAETFNESRTIAQSVVDNINRESYSDYFLICSVLATLPPADDRDNYNTPVEVTIKNR